MVGRLKPGVTPEQALSDAEPRGGGDGAELSGVYGGASASRPVVRPLHEETVEQARPLVRTLFLAVAGSAADCMREPGRFVAGAGDSQTAGGCGAVGAWGQAATLLRQAILESLVLSVTGGVVGLALAAVALRVGVKLLPETLPRIDEIGLDWQVVAFALLLAVVTGVLCGLAPAFAAIRTSVNDTLKEGGRTGTSGGGHARLRSALVIAEIAIALVLLTASGLLLRSFDKMRQVDLGFRPDHTLVAA